MAAVHVMRNTEPDQDAGEVSDDHVAWPGHHRESRDDRSRVKISPEAGAFGAKENMTNRKIRISRLFKYVGMTKFYQFNRPAGTEERWKLIDANLGEDDHTLLDIGCNLGHFTARTAQRGIFSVGADAHLSAITAAIRRNRGQANLAFGNWSFTPENTKALPSFDVILCLSVHHYWYREYGDRKSWEMVRHLAKNAGKLFFEPSVRLKKYGKNPPENFVEGDSAHLEDLIRNEVTGPLNKDIALLGETEAPGEERFRPLFLIT